MLTASRSIVRRLVGATSSTALVAAAFVAPAFLGAQAAPAAPPAPAPAVGEMAPDFTITSVTAAGKTAKPFHLADHKGETVVLAFFPKARTSGCTTQMEAYRDRYATLFNGGKKVTLVSISVDPADTLVAWATDSKFPFMFGSDVDKAVGTKYASATATVHRRLLYVIGPDGKIVYSAAFRPMAEESFTAMSAAIQSASGGGK